MLTATLNFYVKFTFYQPANVIKLKIVGKQKVMFRSKEIESRYCPASSHAALACWTSNSKVVGSSPTGGGIFPF